MTYWRRWQQQRATFHFRIARIGRIKHKSKRLWDTNANFSTLRPSANRNEQQHEPIKRKETLKKLTFHLSLNRSLSLFFAFDWRSAVRCSITRGCDIRYVVCIIQDVLARRLHYVQRAKFWMQKAVYAGWPLVVLFLFGWMDCANIAR